MHGLSTYASQHNRAFLSVIGEHTTGILGSDGGLTTSYDITASSFEGHYSTAAAALRSMLAGPEVGVSPPPESATLRAFPPPASATLQAFQLAEIDEEPRSTMRDSLREALELGRPSVRLASPSASLVLVRGARTLGRASSLTRHPPPAEQRAHVLRGRRRRPALCTRAKRVAARFARGVARARARGSLPAPPPAQRQRRLVVRGHGREPLLDDGLADADADVREARAPEPRALLAGPLPSQAAKPPRPAHLGAVEHVVVGAGPELERADDVVDRRAQYKVDQPLGLVGHELALPGPWASPHPDAHEQRPAAAVAAGLPLPAAEGVGGSRADARVGQV